jgi:hypothetical protein
METYLRQNPPPTRVGSGIRQWMSQFIDDQYRSLNGVAQWLSEIPTRSRVNPVAQMISNYVNTQMGSTAGSYWNNYQDATLVMNQIYQNGPHAGRIIPGAIYAVDDLFKPYVPTE